MLTRACESLSVKVRNKTSICVSVWEQFESSCEVLRRQTKRGSLAAAHCSSAWLGNTNKCSASLRASVFVYSRAHSGNCAALTRSPRCLSARRAHSPTLSAAACLHTAPPRSVYVTILPADLEPVSRPVWSPTSFSASVGRKWPNSAAPVLRQTHCCHIKAQICTVAQLKFPTLLAPPCSQCSHTLRTNVRAEWLFVWAPWREWCCPLVSMEESNQRVY